MPMNIASIPMQTIGPILITGPHVQDSVTVPLATYESPLWPSTNRGAKVSRLSGGIQAVVLSDQMTRSVILEATSNVAASRFVNNLKTYETQFSEIVSKTSRYAKLLNWHAEIVGNLIYLRFAISSGDASGHNMATHSADELLKWLLNQDKTLSYVSVSGNLCTDKKVSAVNGILGRGKSVVAEICVPKQVCLDVLKTTPEKIVDLHIKKNLIGSTLAGGLRTANAHFANVLLAIYLATGQDAANIVEGSQGFVHATERGEQLYFSVSLPNIIVGTVGNGKHLPFVQENLAQMGCLPNALPGANSRRLAVIIASSVLCAEISLLAALTNPGELMRCHIEMERASLENTSKVQI